MGALGASVSNNITRAISENTSIPKIGDEVYPADWFKFELPNYVMQPYSVKIIEESTSGKAYKVGIDTETIDGERDLHYTKYIPKSAVMTKVQREEQLQKEKARFEQGKQRYSEMLKFAKEHNIKGVREGLRKETILNKIKQAGLEYNY